MLRRELDSSLEAAPTDSHGWDALEKVCVEMRVGTEGLESHRFTVLALADYYRDSVISRHQRLLKEITTGTEDKTGKAITYKSAGENIHNIIFSK